MISVVQLSSAKSSQQQPVDHVPRRQEHTISVSPSWTLTLKQDSPQEISLLGLAEVAHSHVWQHLFLQNFFGIFDSSLLCHTWLCSSGTNEVQGHILFLNYKSFIQRWLHLQMQWHHWSHDSQMDSRGSDAPDRSAGAEWKACKNQCKHWPFPSSQGHQSHRWCVPGCLYQTQIPGLERRWWWELPVWCMAA